MNDMNDELEPGLDRQLQRLFGAADTPTDVDFAARVSALIRRRRRAQRLRGLAGALLGALGVAVVAMWAAPLLTRLAVALPLRGDEDLQQFGGWLVSPAGWCCSVALAALVLWRIRALHNQLVAR